MQYRIEKEAIPKQQKIVKILTKKGVILWKEKTYQKQHSAEYQYT